MSILDRYLLNEISRSLLAVTAILLLTTVGLFLGDTLADVARGKVPADLLLSQLGLRSLGALTVLVPLALFLSILMTLGRLYRDSEMVVMTACGVSEVQLLRPLFRLVMPLTVVLLVLGFWISPWAERTARTAVAEATTRVSVSGLQPGRFQAIATEDSVVYVEAVEPGGVFHNAFVHIDRDGRKDIITAREGFQYQDPVSGAKYLALIDGTRSEGVPGEADFRMMRFARNDVRVPERTGPGSTNKQEAKRLSRLLEEADLAAWAEIHWRFAPALALIVLSMLAVPLARSRPRSGYYGNLTLGIAVYVVYANLLALGRTWIENGQVPVWLGLSWLPLIALVAVAILLRPPSRRGRRAAVA
ncbi:MAG: LPS export ABC transporter permease LptF [Xanthomonadales bacterium]|nr:LPS export ABC transporter permease LptF [Xanthomonadales bacterium]